MKYCLKYYLLIVFVFLIGSRFVWAQTDLDAGDVAIVGLNTSTWGSSSPCTQNQDNFAFVLLVDVEAGTEIYFTDNGVQASDGCLRNTEGKLKWTAPAGGVEKGTIISIYTFADNTCQPEVFDGPGAVIDAGSSSAFDLNVSGEQIIIFQDDGVDLNCPDKYLFAITNNETWQSDATNSHTSALPPGLTDGENALALPKQSGDFQNNARFDCGLVNSGSKEAIMESLVDPDNWEGAESATYEMPDCAFTFGGVEIVYITYDQMKLKWPDPQLSGEEVIIVGKAGSPVTVDPSGTDGAGWTVDTDITVAENIGDNTHVLYKGDGSDTTITVTGLIEGNTYYFKTYSHALTSTNWVEGEESIPSYDTAEVQPVTNPLADLSSSDPNGSADLNWNNYIGDPKADWWNGGSMVVYHDGAPVSITQSDLNATGNNSAAFSVSDNLGGGNIVGKVVSTGSPGIPSSATVNNLECGGPYYFKIFHNDGTKWSQARNAGIVTLTSPEIKILGNNNEINDGDNTPDIIDHTDFGLLATGASVQRTFTIRNIGNGVLSISASSLTGDSEFTITSSPAATVSSGSGETAITVTYGPSSIGVHSAVLQISSDDCDEATYEFHLQGEAVNDLTFKPTCGPERTIIRIYGDGFSGLGTHSGDYLKINNTTIPLSAYTVLSNTEIEARVQDGTTDGMVELKNDGTVQQSTQDYIVTEDCLFVCP